MVEIFQAVRPSDPPGARSRDAQGVTCTRSVESCGIAPVRPGVVGSRHMTKKRQTKFKLAYLLDASVIVHQENDFVPLVTVFLPKSGEFIYRLERRKLMWPMTQPPRKVLTEFSDTGVLPEKWSPGPPAPF